MVGFDVEIAELIAHDLGRTPQFVQITFTELDQSVDARRLRHRAQRHRGHAGARARPSRRPFPYYEFQEVLTVRAADRDRYHSLADLPGHRVATLGGTIAYETLLARGADRRHPPVSYDDDVHPYSDLLIGRVDAVLLDNVLADRSLRRNAGSRSSLASVQTAHYVIILAPSATRPARSRERHPAQRDARRPARAIFQKWKVWNDDQPRPLRAAPAAAPLAGATASRPRRPARSRRCPRNGR